MIKGKFSIQVHHGKRPGPGTHWDFRVLIPKDKTVLSWSIPKRKLPSRGEKVLAIWVDDTHPISHMTFEGRLKNGDLVELHDIGTIKILRKTNHKILFELEGSNEQGKYILIHLKQNQWLIIGKS